MAGSHRRATAAAEESILTLGPCSSKRDPSPGARKIAADAGFTCHTCLVRDPLLKNLQGQPEFTSFLATVQQKQKIFREKSFRN